MITRSRKISRATVELSGNAIRLMPLIAVILVALSFDQRASRVHCKRALSRLDLELLSADSLSTQTTRELNRTSGSARLAGPKAENAQRHTSHRQHSEPNQSNRDPLQPSASSQAHDVAQPLRNVTGRLVAEPQPFASLPPPPPSQVHQTNSSAANSLSSVRAKWRQMERSFGEQLARSGSELRATLDQLLRDLDSTSTRNGSNSANGNKRLGGGGVVSPVCRAALNEFLGALLDRELWAGQMLDASALRLPNGLLEGTLTELGHFDECLALAAATTSSSNSNNNNSRQTVGQYCSLHIKPPLISRPRLHTICRRLPSPSSGGGGGGGGNGSSSSGQLMRFLAQNSHQFLYVGLRLGICVPSKCSAGDVQLLLSAYLQRFELVGQVKFCQVQERANPSSSAVDLNANFLVQYFQQACASSSILHKLDRVQQCILLAFCLLFLLIVLGTWLDTSHTHDKQHNRKPPPPPTTTTLAASFVGVPNGLTSGDHLTGRANTLKQNHGAVEIAPSSSSSASSSPPQSHRWKEYRVCGSTSASNNSSACCCSGEATPSALNTADPAAPNLIYLNSQSSCSKGSHVHQASQPQQQQQHQLGLQRNPLVEPGAVISSAAAAGTPSRPTCSAMGGGGIPTMQCDQQLAPQLPPSLVASRASSSSISSGSSSTQTANARPELELLSQQNKQCQVAAKFMIPSRNSEGRARPSFAAERLSAAGTSATTTTSRHYKTADCELPTTSKCRDFLICFSLSSNLRSIGKLTKQPIGQSKPTTTGPGRRIGSEIKVIHGLRTLTMIWIIFGHTIGLVGPEMMNNLFPLAQLSCSSRLLQALLNTTLAVDTFFMISGLVTVISFVRKCTSARSLIGGGAAAAADSQHDDRDGSSSTAPSPGGKLQRCRDSGSQDDDEDLLVLPNTSQQSHPQQVDLAQVNLRRQRGGGGGGGGGGVEPPSSAPIDLDDEISSVDSAITSLSSSASSDRCIGLAGRGGVGKTFAGKISSRKTRRGSDGDDDDEDNHRAAAAAAAKIDSGWWPSDFKPLVWLLMRYLRLTPAYATIIGLSILMPALGSGPFWNETVGQMGPACRVNWWRNLIYLNNFLETDKLCLIHSWYLSNDWQFFLLTLMLFATFYKWKRITLMLMISLIVASTAATFVSTVGNDFPPTIVTTSPAVGERWQFIHQLYYKPWPHLPAYLIGLLVGFLILKLEISPAKSQLTRGGRLVCWTLFSTIAFAVLNSIYPWNMGFQVDPILTGLHSSTFRTLWAACCAWLVYALVTRPRNPLALFLSWHGFQITSRLTYCAYLVHPLVIYYHFGTLRERLDSSPYGQLHRFAGTLIQSYLFAFILSLVIESPSIQLQRFLMRLSETRRGCREKKCKHSHRIASNQNSRSTQEPKIVTGTPQMPCNHHPPDHYYWTNHFAPHHTIDHQHNETLSQQQIPPPTMMMMTMMGHHQNSPQFDTPMVLIHRENLPPSALGGLASDANNNPMQACEFHHQMPAARGGGGGSSSRPPSGSNSSHSVSSALDVEFQKKLAQAIGRGFKIRTKIANGTTIRGQQSAMKRRVSPPKRGSSNSSLHGQKAGLSPVFAPMNSPEDGQQTQDEARFSPPRPPAKPAVMARRGDQLSTFGANQAGPQYVRPTSRKTVQSLEFANVSLSQLEQHPMVPTSRTNVDLKEMIQMKQKLMSRQQQQQHYQDQTKTDV